MFSPVTSKTFCVVTAPQLDVATALASTSSAVLPPRNGSYSKELNRYAALPFPQRKHRRRTIFRSETGERR